VDEGWGGEGQAYIAAVLMGGMAILVIHMRLRGDPQFEPDLGTLPHRPAPFLSLYFAVKDSAFTTGAASKADDSRFMGSIILQRAAHILRSLSEL
jgi:hypothetical protein